LGLEWARFLFKKTIQKLIVGKKKGFIFASAKTLNCIFEVGIDFSLKFIENKIIRMTARIERYK